MFSHNILANVAFRISASWASENLNNGLSVSNLYGEKKCYHLKCLQRTRIIDAKKRKNNYQNLSHIFRCLNCKPMMHAKVGPTRPPFTGYSLRPPGNKSISSGLAYIVLNRAITSGDNSLDKSSQLFAR